MARAFKNDRRAGPMGDWGSRVGEAFRVLCSDGQVRVATVTAQDADTMFTIPARVQVKGKSVSGFVTDWNDIFVYPGVTAPLGTVYMFMQRTDRVNGGMLPAWGKPELSPA